MVSGLHGALYVMKHAEKLVCKIVDELKREDCLELLWPMAAKQDTLPRHREIKLPKSIQNFLRILRRNEPVTNPCIQYHQTKRYK